MVEEESGDDMAYAIFTLENLYHSKTKLTRFSRQLKELTLPHSHSETTSDYASFKKVWDEIECFSCLAHDRDQTDETLSYLV